MPMASMVTTIEMPRSNADGSELTRFVKSWRVAGTYTVATLQGTGAVKMALASRSMLGYPRPLPHT